MEFVVYKVELWQIFAEYFGFQSQLLLRLSIIIIVVCYNRPNSGWCTSRLSVMPSYEIVNYRG
jgi:hypothetical protein